MVSGAAAGANMIVLSSCAGISIGTELLLHQTQSQSSAGSNAFVVVTNIAACTLTLASPLSFAFKSGTFGSTVPEVTQVAIVRHYTTVSVSGNWTANAWNGYCGGTLIHTHIYVYLILYYVLILLA